MSTESRTLEEIKQDILRKQALLFERRLDEYLQLRNLDIPIQERRQTFRNLVAESVPNPNTTEFREQVQQTLFSNEKEVKSNEKDN